VRIVKGLEGNIISPPLKARRTEARRAIKDLNTEGAEDTEGTKIRKGEV
jgi:hypothetical protein